MAQTIDARVKQKTGTAADFAGYTLLEGEIALVKNTPTGPIVNFKVGPGNFDELPFSLTYAGIEPTVEPNTTLPAPEQSGKIMIMKGGNYTQPDGVTPLVAPADSFNVGYWDGTEWSLAVSIETEADLSDYRSIYNATVQSPPPSGFHDFESAVGSVPVDWRRTGLIVTWRSSSNFWQRYQYILSSPSMPTWGNIDNWRNLSQTEEITTVRSYNNEWNATVQSPPSSGFHDFESAIDTVPSFFRRTGNMVTYMFASGRWKTIQYKTTNTTSGSWTNIDNWLEIADSENISIYNATRQSPPPSGFHDFESATLSVPITWRKTGLILTYRQSSNVWLTYQFRMTNTADEPWSNIDNWDSLNYRSEIQQVRSYNNEWNATVQSPPSSGFHDFASAIDTVPSFFRRTGVKVTFRATSTLWRTFQYLLSAPTSPTWDNPDNWIESNPETIPVRHRNGIDNVMAKIRPIDIGQFSIMFMTDPHITPDPPYRYTGIEILSRVMNSLHEQCCFNAVLFGGDYVEKDIATEDEARHYMQKLQEWTAATAAVRIITRGNHEWEPLFDEARFYAYSKRGMYGHMSIVDNPIDQKSDYGYVDYPNEKIRLIFLDLSFLKYDGSLTDPQFDWLVGVLEATAEMDDWMVIVAGHITPYTYTTDNRGNYHALLSHYFEQTTGNLLSSRSSQSVDFTASTSSDLINLAGHTHNSGVHDSSYLSIITAAAQVHQDYVGTVNELAFDIYYINRAARSIDVIRYGRGADRAFEY